MTLQKPPPHMCTINVCKLIIRQYILAINGIYRLVYGQFAVGKSHFTQPSIYTILFPNVLSQTSGKEGEITSMLLLLLLLLLGLTTQLHADVSLVRHLNLKAAADFYSLNHFFF